MLGTFDQARQLAASGSVERGRDLLVTGANEGDASSAAELGYWYLRGEHIPRDMHAARQYFRRSSDLGNIDAAAVDIAMTANGSWGTPDWQSALLGLRKLATVAEWAREDLALLEAMSLDEDGYPRSPAERQVLESTLPVYRLPDFLGAEERQHIANRAAPHLTRATVLHPHSGQMIADPVRTSDAMVIGPAEEDLVLQAIYRRIAQATATDLLQGEPLSVLRYGRGQEYRPHFDAINDARNNRFRTVLIYLNDGYRGGRTLFPEVSLAIEPKAGDAVVFDSLDTAGALLRASRHAGEPVADGIKWMATRWIRLRPYDPWSAASPGG